jgi:mannose-6-phosphate isomerase-like protein (cupin superfamily)
LKNAASLKKLSRAGAHPLAPHYHLETEEVYYIQDGTGQMTIEAEERVVITGDAIFIPRGLTHSLTNTGCEPITTRLRREPIGTRIITRANIQRLESFIA